MSQTDKSKPADRSRREFFRKASLLMTGTAAYAMVPNYAHAGGHGGMLDALAYACHTVYPHDQVDFEHYRACGQGLLDKAKGDPALRQILREGVAALDVVYSKPFAELDYEHREQAMQRMISTSFFDAVRGHTVVGLYNIPGVWKDFGYQGPSFEQGGYINRGFDDIQWIKS